MRHKKGNKKLNRPTDQRLALLKSLTVSLIQFNRIETTSTRAKQAKRMVERLITVAKQDTVASKRQLFKTINNKDFVKNICELSKKYKDRKGGYARLIKCGHRRGDAAEVSILELV